MVSSQFSKNEFPNLKPPILKFMKQIEMEWILTLPPLVNVPQPNFMADEYDKYAKIHQIKY